MAGFGPNSFHQLFGGRSFCQGEVFYDSLSLFLITCRCWQGLWLRLWRWCQGNRLPLLSSGKWSLSLPTNHQLPLKSPLKPLVCERFRKPISCFICPGDKAPGTQMIISNPVLPFLEKFSLPFCPRPVSQEGKEVMVNGAPVRSKARVVSVEVEVPLFLSYWAWAFRVPGHSFPLAELVFFRDAEANVLLKR